MSTSTTIEHLAVDVDESAVLVRIRVRGSLDIFTGPILTEVLEQLFIVGQRPILIDLNELEFMDCVGLSVFLLADDRARRSALVFTGCRPNVRRVFELTSHAELLDRTFTRDLERTSRKGWPAVDGLRRDGPS